MDKNKRLVTYTKLNKNTASKKILNQQKNYVSFSNKFYVLVLLLFHRETTLHCVVELEIYLRSQIN